VVGQQKQTPARGTVAIRPLNNDRPQRKGHNATSNALPASDIFALDASLRAGDISVPCSPIMGGVILLGQDGTFFGWRSGHLVADRGAI